MKPLWNLDAPNDWISRTKRCAYFVNPSINEWIISETNITSHTTLVKLLRNMKPLRNIDAPNGRISHTKRCAHFVKPSINEWILSETNIPSYQISVKLLWNMKPVWNLDALNIFSYQTMLLLSETVYKRVNHKWNQSNLVPNPNETIMKYETYVKTRCTKRLLVRNDACNLWNSL
jgi:hypothetical protein